MLTGAEPETGSGADSRPAARKPRRSAMRSMGSASRELLLVVVGALVVSSLLRAFVGQMFSIPSQSMENTLLVGDRVLVQKVVDFNRGDVVVFADPGNWLDEPPEVRGPIGQALEFVGVLPDTSTEHLIKRVIGLPGDRVRCCDAQGRLTVNGEPLEEDYLYADSAGPVQPSDVRFTVVVPKGRIFVMGDHRDLSADSRCHLSDISIQGPPGTTAFVPEDQVVGEAFAVVAPLRRAEVLDRPATFADVPAAEEPAPARAVIKPEGVTC